MASKSSVDQAPVRRAPMTSAQVAAWFGEAIRRGAKPTAAQCEGIAREVNKRTLNHLRSAAHPAKIRASVQPVDGNKDFVAAMVAVSKEAKSLHGSMAHLKGMCADFCPPELDLTIEALHTYVETFSGPPIGRPPATWTFLYKPILREIMTALQAAGRRVSPSSEPTRPTSPAVVVLCQCLNHAADADITPSAVGSHIAKRKARQRRPQGMAKRSLH